MKVGILGAGQLARMLALAGYPLGIDVICLDSKADACAAQVTKVITADYTSNARVTEFLAQVDCLTYETENIPAAFAAHVSKTRPLHPNLEILQITQDRLLEKKLFAELAIPTALNAPVESYASLLTLITEFDFPVILKTCRNGYDGKGQAMIRNQEQAEAAWQQLQAQPLILEKLVPFDFEVSLIAVRHPRGDMRFYPLVLNQHRHGILHTSTAPFINSDLQALATQHARKILEKFNYIGVMTIEFFHVNGELIGNEIAPRVHNSGHWTIEGAVTSQFENHLRAICELPLGETTARGVSKMINCISQEPARTDILAIPGAHYHSYGKKPLPGRKLGHVTVVADTADEVEKRAAQIEI